MLPCKSEDTKERVDFGVVDTVEDVGRIPTVDDNYHGLTLSVVLIYLVKRSSGPRLNRVYADVQETRIGSHPR